MALKGSDSKLIATKRILELFEGSFQYDKEIRIPMIENGEEVQLKCVLTCAKVNVEQNGENAIPGEVKASSVISDTNPVVSNIEPTQEEKENVKKLISALGL